MGKIRLQKFLAEAGVASRRAAEQLMLEGRVTVNGVPVRLLGTKVDPEKDVVQVDGEVVRPRKKLYVALHKPRGYVTTRSDEKGRKCVLDLLPPEWRNLYPVGRLDRQSEGLLFLTNDGDFAFRLTHPRFGVPKTYFVVVQGKVEPAHIERLRKGIRDRGQLLRVKEARLLTSARTRSRLELVLTEGKNREVRRMFKALGFRVERLVRTKIGPIPLGELPEGKWRVLTKTEVQTLFRLTESPQTASAKSSSQSKSSSSPSRKKSPASPIQAP